MLFYKKSASSVFKSHYKSMLRIAKRSNACKNPEFELLPAMFIISDYAALSAGKDRNKIANTIIQGFISQHITDSVKFNKRCDFYGEIIREKEPRCEWLFGDHSAINNNAITKCAAAFLDILYNPHCANDYDNAPVVLFGISDPVTFTQNVAIPLLHMFTQLYKDIYDL